MISRLMYLHRTRVGRFLDRNEHYRVTFRPGNPSKMRYLGPSGIRSCTSSTQGRQGSLQRGYPCPGLKTCRYCGTHIGGSSNLAAQRGGGGSSSNQSQSTTLVMNTKPAESFRHCSIIRGSYSNHSTESQPLSSLELTQLVQAVASSLPCGALLVLPIRTLKSYPSARRTVHINSTSDSKACPTGNPRRSFVNPLLGYSVQIDSSFSFALRLCLIVQALRQDDVCEVFMKGDSQYD
ncbi:hypothetical protein EDD37DRAFT_480798 [Exophiala viscosa]|uniref:uncharacterized protein n=1 Tax=Exophiala viscosa TaxID=2486360 RepID=UPI002191C5B8|nr:hypothetical protein EDD37DRAFT_480798 [Exophiala viscosa]